MDLGTTVTCEFGDYLILGFSKEWIKVNNGNNLEFNAKLTENGKLVLSTNLPLRDRTSTKEIDSSDNTF